MSLAENLKNLRIRKQYSQAELAKLVGVSQQTISQVETNQISLNVETAVAIAKKLDTTAEQLVDGQTAENKNVQSTEHFETQEVKKRWQY